MPLIPRTYGLLDQVLDDENAIRPSLSTQTGPSPWYLRPLGAMPSALLQDNSPGPRPGLLDPIEDLSRRDVLRNIALAVTAVAKIDAAPRPEPEASPPTSCATLVPTPLHGSTETNDERRRDLDTPRGHAQRQICS